MKIDIHNHALPSPVIELLQENDSFGVTVKDGVVQGRLADHQLFPSLHDPTAKLAELRDRGLDAAVISLAPRMFSYGLDLTNAELLAEVANRGMAEMCAEHPTRLWWLAQVPLQDPQSAGDILRAAVANGAVGAGVGSWTGTQRLDEPMYEPFWSVVEELDVPVFIHNANNTPIPSLGEFYLGNVIGNLVETTICAERLIASGTLDRHPGVRIVLGHAGGLFPWQAGRLAHARSVRAELADMRRDPWSYVGQLLFDTITHDVKALRYMVDRVGVENVLVGTDLPYDMSSTTPWESLVEAVGDRVAAEIAEANPVRQFKL
jgi:aminocarboxymuconate-semialdehyde decarboxylase